MKLIDLSHTIVNYMQVYPGDEPPMLHSTHSPETDGYSNSQLTIGMHVGTHMDGPLHMIGHEPMLCDIPIESFMGKACVIDIRDSKIFDDCFLVRQKAFGCDVVLFYTGYGSLFGTPGYLRGFPLVDVTVAHTLVDMGIRLFGIDTLGPDEYPHNTHRVLLGNGILIVENLTNLEQLLACDEFKVIALPLKIQADSAPARVIALMDKE